MTDTRQDDEGDALLAALAERGVYSPGDLEIWERDLREPVTGNCPECDAPIGHIAVGCVHWPSPAPTPAPETD